LSRPRKKGSLRSIKSANIQPDDYVVSGTCTANLHGMCDELFETISQALLAGVDRDALSGWGAFVHVITKDGVTTRELKGRMD